MQKHAFLLLALFVAPVLTGCGGGSSNFSGPNSNSEVGTGTLVVTVQDASGGSVADGAAVVLLEERGLPTRRSRVVFYSVKPGKYFVQARSQSIGLPGDGQNVEIKANKTLNITLSI
jgi:hypothetical protein